MDFRLLGPLDVLNDREPVPISAGKQRALLAYLLLQANRTVSRDQIVDALWGEQVPDSARKMVQIHVSALRKALPEPRLLTRPPGYLIEVGDDELDLSLFQRSVAGARQARRRTTPSRPGGCWTRPWSCGGGRRWPSSRSRSPGLRARAWRSSGSPRRSGGSRPTSRSAMTATSSASSSG